MAPMETRRLKGLGQWPAQTETRNLEWPGPICPHLRQPQMATRRLGAWAGSLRRPVRAELVASADRYQANLGARRRVEIDGDQETLEARLAFGINRDQETQGAGPGGSGSDKGSPPAGCSGSEKGSLPSGGSGSGKESPPLGSSGSDEESLLRLGRAEPAGWWLGLRQGKPAGWRLRLKRGEPTGWQLWNI